MRTYVFVDGENHYLRSLEACASIACPLMARALSRAPLIGSGLSGFPQAIANHRFGFEPDLQLFWDCDLLIPTRASAPDQAIISRAVYTCSCTGDEDKAHGMRVALRKWGFEPLVLVEPKDLRRRREEQREKRQLLDKPKGCDIALATRIVADAAADLYDCALLFTSDADFLPAVEAVRRMGKVFWVYGYRDVLSTRSPYLHVPDRFYDLRQHLEGVYANNRKPIDDQIAILAEEEAAVE